MTSATERTMTNTAATALEEISGALDALRTDQRQLDQDGVFVGVSRQALDEVLTHIAALEAELATQRRVGVHEICSMCGLDLRKATTECPTWHGLDHLGCDYAKKAEAQLSTRLPTEAQISYLLEVLAREGVANDGGDFMRRKISKAILALLSGAATPAPTAALTEDDVWLKPPPHFSSDPRWQRQPQSNEEWNAHKDTDRQFNAKRRLAFAGDVDDPRAPKCMALVSRLDLSVVLGRLTWLEARFENTRGSALPSTPEPAAKSPLQGAEE